MQAAPHIHVKGAREHNLKNLELRIPRIQFDELPVPRIIVMKITAGAAPDIGRLRKLVSERIPGASLDDHHGFVARMRAMASATLLGGIAVLLLVLAATVLSVTFATRAAMASNRPVIEVLHLIGAKDNFIRRISSSIT